MAASKTRPTFKAFILVGRLSLAAIKIHPEAAGRDAGPTDYFPVAQAFQPLPAPAKACGDKIFSRRYR
jgi:hypothetical protein